MVDATSASIANATLKCSDEKKVPIAFYRNVKTGDYTWTCDSEITCRPPGEIVWVPSKLDESEVRGRCLAKCESGQRDKNGTCTESMTATVPHEQPTPTVIAAKEPGTPACQDDPSTTAKPLTPAEARIMIRALPLDANDVDFGRITKFFDLYRHILETHSDPRKCEVIRIMDHASKWMAGATALTNLGKTQFSLTTDYSEVATWLRPPIGQKYIPFLEEVESVVKDASSVMGLFYAAYVRSDPNFGSAEKTALEFQFKGDNALSVQNAQVLQAWENNRDKVFNIR